ncbi:hypothetical protein DFH06DRAFT_1147931 [Mycena polygramma]|nr:hypothetical protein DFH06DRAFT_1147931 [Mycena polygramma]
MVDYASSGVRRRGRSSGYPHKACMNCRQRKMRCDGERPVCRRCRLQPPRSLNPCKYSHAPVGGGSSQEMIAAEEGADEPEQESSMVLLFEPYSKRGGTMPRMDIFCYHFAGCQFFFLDPAPFQQSALGRPYLLPRGLLNAVSLWATRFSPSVSLGSRYSKEELLRRTVYHLAREVATIDSPRNYQLIPLIQAEVLLSLYYMDAGDLLQGLHVPPSQSVDIGRRKELVGGFWTVVVLNNHFVAASGVPSSIPCDILAARWRTDIIPGSASSSDPFSDGDDVHNHSPLTLYLKASALLACAITFVTRNPGECLPHPPEFWTISDRLEVFCSQLLPMDASAPTDGMALVRDLLANAAIIRLHAPFSAMDEASRSICLATASCVARRLIDARLTEWYHASPIFGPILAAFIDFLIPNLSFGAPAQGDLKTILSAMHTLARFSPLIHVRAMDRFRLDGPLVESVPVKSRLGENWEKERHTVTGRMNARDRRVHGPPPNRTGSPMESSLIIAQRVMDAFHMRADRYWYATEDLSAKDNANQSTKGITGHIISERCLYANGSSFGVYEDLVRSPPGESASQRGASFSNWEATVEDITGDSNHTTEHWGLSAKHQSCYRLEFNREREKKRPTEDVSNSPHPNRTGYPTNTLWLLIEY